MDVSITSDAERIAKLFAGQAERLRDLSPVLKNIAAEIDSRTADNLQRSQRIDGLPFADLAESTKLARLRRRRGAYRKATKVARVTKAQRRALARGMRSSDYAKWAAAQAQGARLRISRRGQRAAGIAAALDDANFKPLLDTGRGARSANARPHGKDTVRWSVVAYMVPHIGGAHNNRPPQRNYSVFRYWNGSWELAPAMQKFIDAALHAHIAGGAP